MSNDRFVGVVMSPGIPEPMSADDGIGCIPGTGKVRVYQFQGHRPIPTDRIEEVTSLWGVADGKFVVANHVSVGDDARWWVETSGPH